MTTTIIDISKWQGALDWGAVRAARAAGLIGAVIIRATYGTSTDPQLARNAAQARALDIPRGFYHFAYPARSSARAQAEKFLDATDLRPGEVAALDIEHDPAGRGIEPGDVPWMTEWCRIVRDATGAPPLAYMNSAMLRELDWQPLRALGCPLWIANYGPNNGRPNTPPGAGEWGNWALWQFTSKFPFAGLQVDANLFRGTPDQFRALGTPGDNPMPWTEKDYIFDIQHVLKDEGLYSDEPDGIAGPMTRDGVHTLKNIRHALAGALAVARADSETARAQLHEVADARDKALAEIERLKAASPTQAKLDQLQADLEAALAKVRA